MAGDPQAAVDRRVAARHLLQSPLMCAEHDPDIFRLIRRHEGDLDRWFTQRLGYRLHVDADTARLFKSGVVVDHRGLLTSSGRALNQLEYVMLALALASTAAGPAVVSLKDLVTAVRSCAAEADITLSGDSGERRALVTAMRWMVDHGIATELYAHVDSYATDETADAVLKIRPDRIALLPLPAIVGATDVATVLRRAERRNASRQWMRGRLVEDPVLYRDDLLLAEWAELRRRLGEEERILDEMFGLVLEARAEGIAAIDPGGTLAVRRFPAGGTVHHAALLLVEALVRDTDNGDWPPYENRGSGDGGERNNANGVGVGVGDSHQVASCAWSDLVARIAQLADQHRRRWSNDLVAAPERLAKQVVDLLVELRLATLEVTNSGDDVVRLLPAAARFRPIDATASAHGDSADTQESLW